MGEMSFSYRDLYPDMPGIGETSTDVIPEADDMEALAENAEEAGTASSTHARGKMIILGVAVIVALVVFLGGGDR